MLKTNSSDALPSLALPSSSAKEGNSSLADPQQVISTFKNQSPDLLPQLPPHLKEDAAGLRHSPAPIPERFSGEQLQTAAVQDVQDHQSYSAKRLPEMLRVFVYRSDEAFLLPHSPNPIYWELARDEIYNNPARLPEIARLFAYPTDVNRRARRVIYALSDLPRKGSLEESFSALATRLTKKIDITDFNPFSSPLRTAIVVGLELEEVEISVDVAKRDSDAAKLAAENLNVFLSLKNEELAKLKIENIPLIELPLKMGEAFPNLLELSLLDLNLSDISALRSLPKLQVLRLKGEFPEDTVKELQKQLPKTRVEWNN